MWMYSKQKMASILKAISTNHMPKIWVSRFENSGHGL